MINLLGEIIGGRITIKSRGAACKLRCHLFKKVTYFFVIFPYSSISRLYPPNSPMHLLRIPISASAGKI